MVPMARRSALLLALLVACGGAKEEAPAKPAAATGGALPASPAGGRSAPARSPVEAPKPDPAVPPAVVDAAPPLDAAPPPDAALALAPDAGTAGEKKLKDLRVLPKTWRYAQVEKHMKEVVSAGLGVKCDFCHVKGDFAADHEHKREAREMMAMTDGLNKKWFGGKRRVTCATCHKGKPEPEPK